MDTRLTSEQELVQETARDLFESLGGTELARRQMAGDDTVVSEVWGEIADLDFPAITVPLGQGGLGEGMPSLVTLLEVFGRYAIPGPFAETTAFAVPLIEELGAEEQHSALLGPVAEGTTRCSLALYDDRTEPLPESIQLSAEPVDGGYRLDGTKTLVPYADVADVILVVTRHTGSGYDGLSVFAVDVEETPVEMNQLGSTDRVRPLYEVSFDGVTVRSDALLGTYGECGDALQLAADRLDVARCAMLVGAGRRSVELSSAHADDRVQYGQPIGRFQAVKHRIVEMAIDVEQARSLTHHAAWAFGSPESGAPLAATMAKYYTSTHLPGVFVDDIKNHGGMGFTWDHDGHIYLKQAKSLTNLMGSSHTQQDRIAELRGYADRGLPDYPELTEIVDR